MPSFLPSKRKACLKVILVAVAQHNIFSLLHATHLGYFVYRATTTSVHQQHRILHSILGNLKN